MRFPVAVILLTASLGSAFAQTAPSSPPALPPPAAAAPAQPTQSIPGKRVMCQQDVAAKRLRGQDKRDQMQLCMAQGQLDCVRQAIEQKTAGAQRKDFMQSCMGRKSPSPL